jgi:hypothetical protein
MNSLIQTMLPCILNFINCHFRDLYLDLRNLKKLFFEHFSKSYVVSPEEENSRGSEMIDKYRSIAHYKVFHWRLEIA